MNKIFGKSGLLFNFLLVLFIFIAGPNEVSAKTTINKAETIEVNSTKKGTITDSSSKHYYKFTLKSPGNITISLKNYTTHEAYASITNLKGDEFISVTSIENSSVAGYESNQIGLPAGTYYIGINSDYVYGNVKFPYEVKLKYEKSNFYEKEFNDTINTANPIEVNKTYKGKIKGYRDKDYFKITLPKDGNVTLKMKNVASQSWDMHIQDLKGNVFTSLSTDREASVSGHKTAQVGLSKGTYYIKVEENYLDYNYTEPYSFSVNFKASSVYEKEFNNTLKTATSMKLNTVYNGIINDSYSDLDFYKFTVPATGTATLSLSNKPDSAWNGTLYDSKGNEINDFNTNRDSSATGYTTLSETLKKGTYYFKVTSYWGAEKVPYKLKAVVKSSKLKSSQVTVKNNKGKNDTIKVTGIKKGDVIKVYNAKSKGKQIASGTAKGTSLTLSVKQLGTKSSNVYVTVTKPKLSESSRLKSAYKGEKSNKLKANQITIKNNKGKKDTIKVTKIKKGDVIKVYNKSSGGKRIATITSKGKSTTLSVKQLGKKSGKVYVTITNSKQLESARTTKNYKAEKK